MVPILEDTPAVLSLGKLCEEHGKTFEWASGQKPLLTNSGKGFCATRNISCRLLSQDWRQVSQARAHVLLQHRYRRTRMMTLRQVQHHNEVTIRTFWHREIDRAICQSSLWSSQRISKTKKSQHKGKHPQTLLKVQIRNVLPKWYQQATIF